MKPPRRTPKPFTLEVRTAGRQARMPSLNPQPDWPAVPEEPQTPAERPAEPADVPAAVMPSGRILPALDDPGTLMSEPVPRGQRKMRSDAGKKRGRHLTTTETAVVERGIHADLPRKPRHWHAVPGLTIESRWPMDDTPKEPAATASAPELAEPPADVPPVGQVASTASPGLPRLPRSTFKLGERWKARLPAMALARRGRTRR